MNLKRLNHISSENKIFKGQILKVSSNHENISNSNYSPNTYSPSSQPYFQKPLNNSTQLRSFKPWGDNKNYGVLWLTNHNEKVLCASDGIILKNDYLRGYGQYYYY